MRKNSNLVPKTWNQINARNFELYTMKYHRDNYNQETYHWNTIPEYILYESGFIHNYNNLRLTRKRVLEEQGRYYNPIREYGLDGISIERNENNDEIIKYPLAGGYEFKINPTYSDQNYTVISTYWDTNCIDNQEFYDNLNSINPSEENYIQNISNFALKIQENCKNTIQYNFVLLTYPMHLYDQIVFHIFDDMVVDRFPSFPLHHQANDQSLLIEPLI